MKKKIQIIKYLENIFTIRIHHVEQKELYEDNLIKKKPEL